jgi:EAL and modified HD-GYP domain-containing signal transduction protein
MFGKKTYHEIDRYLTEKKHLLHGIKFLAEKVETREEFETLQPGRICSFSGFSSADRRSSNKCLSQNPMVLSSLMMEVNRESPDFTVLERLLKNDLTLSYKIMRYVKHAVQITRYYSVRELTLKEMLMYLGYNEIRRLFRWLLFPASGFRVSANFIV